MLGIFNSRQQLARAVLATDLSRQAEVSRIKLAFHWCAIGVPLADYAAIDCSVAFGAMSVIKEHDCVVLLGDVTEDGLEAGDIGTVVHVHSAGEPQPKRNGMNHGGTEKLNRKNAKGAKQGSRGGAALQGRVPTDYTYRARKKS